MTAPRVLIAGVGYRNLRGDAGGPLMVDRLDSHAFRGPASVNVEDLSFGPIAVVQRFEDDLPHNPFDLAIFVTGYPRTPLREPGTLSCYRWDGVLPDNEEVQRAVTARGALHGQRGGRLEERLDPPCAIGQDQVAGQRRDPGNVAGLADAAHGKQN